MSTEEKFRNILRLIWRNKPDGATTFGPCSRGCGGAARGGSVCLGCATADLQLMVGEDFATLYVNAVVMVRELEQQMGARLGI